MTRWTWAGWLAVGTLGCLLASDARALTSCSFDSVSGVAFGGYDTFSSSPLDATGSVTFTCQGVTGADAVVIDLSTGGASGYAPRTLSSGGETLGYNLYTGAARTVIWGNGGGGTGHYGPVNPPDGTGTTVTVYGRVPALQNVGVGAYTDTITATILY